MTMSEEERQELLHMKEAQDKRLDIPGLTRTEALVLTELEDIEKDEGTVSLEALKNVLVTVPRHQIRTALLSLIRKKLVRSPFKAGTLLFGVTTKGENLVNG